MEYTLLSNLLEQTHLRKRADSGWKKEAWNSVIEAIQEEPGVQMTEGR
jgi:hypothetical protein